MQITTRMVGADKFQTGVNQFARRMPGITAEQMEKAMTRAMKKSVPWQGGSSYSVPERPSYKRTGTLGQSTWVEASASERGSYARVHSEAVSPHGVEYSRYVIGDASGQGQAGVHVGRWVTMRQAVDEELKPLTESVNQELQTAIRDEGIGL